jgi:hypothetical protein
MQQSIRIVINVGPIGHHKVRHTIFPAMTFDDPDSGVNSYEHGECRNGEAESESENPPNKARIVGVYEIVGFSRRCWQRRALESGRNLRWVEASSCHCDLKTRLSHC